MAVTTVTAENNPANDRPNWDAAVAAAADGDTLLARIGASGEDFDMGTGRVLITDKTLTIAGDMSAGSKPTFKNGGDLAGESVFTVFNPAQDKDIVFEDLKFKEYRSRAIFIREALSAIVRRCDLTQDNWTGRAVPNFVAGANENIGVGMFVNGTKKFCTVEDNTLDLFTDASPADGTNLFTFGIETDFHARDSRVLVQRNVIRNCSANGYAQLRSEGGVEILDNFIDAADWIPGRGDGFNHLRLLHTYSASAALHVVEPNALPDIVRGNTFILRAKDQVGGFDANVIFKLPLGTRQQLNTIISKVDDVTANRPLAALRVTGADNSHVGQNTVIGQFKDGIRVEANFRGVPSSGVAVMGNNLTAMQAGDAELRFTSSAFNCAANGKFRTVDNTGSNNRVTGQGPVSGGIGDVISASEPGFMTEQES